jgi:hypothetical protein
LLTWFEYLSAFVASRGERLIVALATIKQFVLRAERLVNERQLANIAKKALLVPMFFLVGQIFRVGANLFLAFFAVVGKQLFVAGNAMRMLVFEYVTRASQRFVAMPATKMISMIILIHCSCVLAVEY